MHVAARGRWACRPAARALAGYPKGPLSLLSPHLRASCPKPRRRSPGVKAPEAPGGNASVPSGRSRTSRAAGPAGSPRAPGRAGRRAERLPARREARGAPGRRAGLSPHTPAEPPEPRFPTGGEGAVSSRGGMGTCRRGSRLAGRVRGCGAGAGSQPGRPGPVSARQACHTGHVGKASPDGFPNGPP